MKKVRINNDNNNNDNNNNNSTAVTTEKQLLQKSRAVNIAAKLGRHLLQFYKCEPHVYRRAREHHFQDQRRLTNHYSLSNIKTLTGQVPEVLSQPKLLRHRSRKQT